MPSSTVYLALGSNLGDRSGFLREACARIAATPGIAVAAQSKVYETDAVADHPQPPYLNAVLRATTALSPDDLLARCLKIEEELGRVRPVGTSRASRTVDIDILLYDDRHIDGPRLTVPHPRLLARPFVRIPLSEVATPGLRHPLTGQPLDQASPHPSVRHARV
jgi:2-amino-4-hydroxy-6-hydroxymethyldihydropteridine diphosphokinase